jgi:hypothetical protein
MVLAKETTTVPAASPNNAPPAMVMTAAPGSESEVTRI